MKPRNKFEKEILKASESLRPISERQIKWGYRHAVSHFGRRNSDGTILCAECGHRYHTSGKGEHSICPKCHTRLNIVNNPRQRKFKEQDYFAVVDTCKGYQVVRYIMVYHTATIGKEPEYSHCEVMQRWIAPDGGKVTLARMRQTLGTMYYDLWIPSSELTLRRENQIYGYIETPFTYPRMNLLPMFRKLGLKNGTFGIDPQRLMSYVKDNNRAETLLKVGQTKLLKLFMDDTAKDIENYWASIRICIRNHYKVTKTSEWCDYIDTLKYLGKDVHNAKYVCPTDIIKAHNKAMRKALNIAEMEEINGNTPEFLAKEMRYKMAKGMFFGLIFTDGEITVRVIESVKDMVLEGKAMHHCVGRYYDKAKSLILSATINSARVETVEVNLDTLKVVQSRGVNNQNTPQHDRIVDLVNSNARLIKERMTA